MSLGRIGILAAPAGSGKKPLISRNENSVLPLAGRSMKVLSSEAKDGQKVTASWPVWYYLTLGIPVLIETLSLFFNELLHRETTGKELSFRFRYDRDFTDTIAPHVSNLHSYNEFAVRILSKIELNKAVKIVQEKIKEKERAFAKRDFAEHASLNLQLEAYFSLLEKNSQSKLTRKTISEKDWAVIDELDYEIAKDYFLSLKEVFNSGWFKNHIFPSKVDFQTHLGNDKIESKKPCGKFDSFGIHYQEAVVAESLAMSFAYIEGLEGKTLDLPRYDEQTQAYRSTTYKIKTIYLGDELPCYIFESEERDAPPWFVIRGTQYNQARIGSLESILADSIDHKCVARNIINKALVHKPFVEKNGVKVESESLSEMFLRLKKENKHVIVAGHSLGGAIANSLAVDFPDSIKKVYAFSAPGVSRRTGLRWKELPKSQQNNILNFDFQGDIIPSGGHCLIGRHFAIKGVPYYHKRGGIYPTHIQSHLNRQFSIQQIDLEKENRKFARRFIETVRVIVGYCFRALLFVFGRSYLPDWWRNRKVYKKEANKYRETLKALSAKPS